MDLRDEIIEYLETNYDEETVANLIGEQINDYLDEDWDEDYESEHDWYKDHGNREAEDDVLDHIMFELKQKFSFTEEFYFDEYGETIEDLIKEYCDLLDC